MNDPGDIQCGDGRDGRPVSPATLAGWEDARIAELARLRAENARLTKENIALRERLAVVGARKP